MVPKLFLILTLALLTRQPLSAQGRYYAGAVAGIATLSADAKTVIEPAASSISLYRPFNGAAVNAFAGAHLTDIVSVQGNYVWNSNNLTLFSTRFSGGRESLIEEERSSRQDAVIGDVLVYFRDRRQWARPYLSAGAGVARLQTEPGTVTAARGISPAALPKFSTSAVAMRVAVGIDVALGSGLSFRFTFSETVRSNPISGRLSPPGERNLANFQNLFGILKRF